MDTQEVANVLLKMDQQAEDAEAPVAAEAPTAPPPAEAAPPVETPPPPEAPPEEPAESVPEEDPAIASIKASAADLQRQLKAAEREQERWRKQADYWMQAFQTYTPPPQQAKPDAPPEPSPYPAKPVLANFQDYDQYVESLTDWKLQKREIDARQNIERQMQQRQQQDVQTYLNTRMAEGLKKYPDEFWSRADEVGNRITEDMRRVIFKSDNFPDLVMHLGKNLAEVERIATIADPDDRSYELKSIARRLKSEQNLKSKEQTQPAAVEKPGAPAAPRPLLDEKRAIQKAQESGNIRDWAKVIELREATPRKLQ